MNHTTVLKEVRQLQLQKTHTIWQMNKSYWRSLARNALDNEQAGFERAARQFEQAARDEVQPAVANTAEIGRVILVSPPSNVEQRAEDHFSQQQISLLTDMHTASERALESLEQSLVPEAYAEMGLQHQHNSSQLFPFEPESLWYAAAIEHVQNSGWQEIEQLRNKSRQSNLEGTLNQTLYDPLRHQVLNFKK